MASPNVTNRGGPVIASPQIVPIIWGNGWPYDAGSPLANQLLAFLQFFVGPNSPQMAMLREYSTSSLVITPGGVVGNQVITAPGNPPSTLSDAQIQSALQGWIANAGNQTPGFPQPGPNVMYILFLPQAVSVTFRGKTSCGATNSFAGYHNTVGSVIYAVLPTCVTPTTTPYASVLVVLTTVCSHELGEAITDPDSNGWQDNNTNPRFEIGDICQGVVQGVGYQQLNANAGIVKAPGNQSFQVQALWSQTQNNCVFGPPVQPKFLTLPPVVFGGQPFSGTLTLNAPVPAFPAAGITITLASDNPAVTLTPGSVVIAPGTESATFSATTTAVPQALTVAVTATLGAQSINQLLTVLPPVIANFEYTPSAAQGYAYPPDAPEGALTLNLPAPTGGLIASVVSSEHLLVVPIPDELPITAGAVSPSVKYYLQVNPVGVTTPVTLTANVAGSSLSFGFDVLAGGPSNIVVKGLTLNPVSVTGGTTAFATFTLAAPVGPAGGKVTVASSNPTEAPVPGTVTLGAGATGGSFQIHTKPLQSPIHRVYATITVGQDGAPVHALLTITS
jgi:hypothetical protein